MNTLEIIILGIALAIDALLVSFTYGLILRENRIRNCLKLSFSFGFFQALMPIIGYFFTEIITVHTIKHSKLIVFIIFTILGSKFLKDSFEKENKSEIICISFICLLYLSVATSIDALVAGISLRLTNTNLIFSIIIIGLVTIILSAVSFQISNNLKKIPKQTITIAGAILLYALAIKNII